jgi:hypothetical protein
VGIYKSLTDTWGTRPRSFISGNNVSNFLYSAFAVLAKLAAATVHLRIYLQTQLMTTSLVVSFSYSPSEVRRKDWIYGPLVVRLESLFVQWGGYIRADILGETRHIIVSSYQLLQGAPQFITQILSALASNRKPQKS